MFCVTDVGYILSGIKRQASIGAKELAETLITKALFRQQRRAMREITDLQEGLAQRRIELAENIHDHAKVFWPARIGLLHGAFSNPRYQTQPTAFGGSGEQAHTDAFDQGYADWRKYVKLSGRPPSFAMRSRWKRFQAVNETDGANFMLRHEEAYKNAMDDIRYSRQYSAIGGGRGILVGSLSFENAGLTAGLGAGAIMMSALNTMQSATGMAFQVFGDGGWNEDGRKPVEGVTGPTNRTWANHDILDPLLGGS